MPLPFFVSGALFTSVASGIWSYNRENYMWDWQNRQARDFQVQNMIVSRYGLFREDIRDLAGLTTSKMDSYLVVNTLKLGFIVTIYFNYDRTDTPQPEGNIAEKQFTLLFSVCFLTAFQLLLTSVWFSMHASVVAQSFMTKMLLQTVRIPFPSDQEISGAAPEAHEYERELSTAFRIPLMRSRSSPLPPPPVSGGGLSSSASQAGSSRRSSRTQLGTPTFGNEASRQPSLEGRPPSRDELRAAFSARAVHPTVPEDQSSCWEDESIFGQWGRPASQASAQATLDGSGRQSTSGSDRRTAEAKEEKSYHGAVDVFFNRKAWATQPFVKEWAGTTWKVSSGVAPHLKFYGFVMSNWQPFDLYSKICMSIGTSTMLSGIAYFAIFYSRPPPSSESVINVQTEGWYTFIFMSMLAWWSVTLDLILSPWEHVLAGVLALGAPACVVLLGVLAGRPVWLLPIAVFLQAMWVWFLCGTAVILQDGWPRRWRASLFLDVLGTRGAPRPLPSHTPSTSSCRASATELLKCLKAALELPMPQQAMEELLRTCQRLEEALASAGPVAAAAAEGGGGGTDKGFWLVLPAQEGASPRTHWIQSLSGEDPGGVGPGAVQTATLEELLGAGHSAVTALYMEEASTKWTPEDAEQLAQYGGQQRQSTVQSFESQFRSKGLSARSSMGKSAHRFFRATVAFVSLSWATAVGACLAMRDGPGQAPPSGGELVMADFTTLLGRWLAGQSAATVWARTISSEPLVLPRPWYAPTALSCSAGGRRLAVADGVRAFATAANGTGWLGPFAACGGADVAAVAFAPGEEEEDDWPELVAASAGGAFSLPSGPEGAESCEAAAWAASAAGAASGPTALALDDVPGGGRGGLRGLAVRDGQLLALEAAAGGAWEVAGVLPSPSRGPRRWAGVALHAGVGLALDEEGAVFELDGDSGRWRGPWHLEETGVAWRGVCFAGEGRWLALGERGAEGRGAGLPRRRSFELWHFERPSEPVEQDWLVGRGAPRVPASMEMV